MEEESQREKRSAERKNSVKDSLRSEALRMIEKKITCEELDLSQSDEEIDIVIKQHINESRVNSDISRSDEIIVNLGDENIAGAMNLVSKEGNLDGKSKQQQMLEQLNQQYEKERQNSINSLRINKKMMRRQAKLDAEADSKWMIFRDLDAFDEADMVKVAKFMKSMLTVYGKLSTLKPIDSTLLRKFSDNSAANSISATTDSADDSSVATTEDQVPSAATMEALRLLESKSPDPLIRRRSPGSFVSTSSLVMDANASGSDMGMFSAERDSLDGNSGGNGIQLSRSMSTSVIQDQMRRVGAVQRNGFPAQQRTSSMDAESFGVVRKGLAALDAAAPHVSNVSVSKDALVSKPGRPKQMILAQRNNSLSDLENLLMQGRMVITPTSAMSLAAVPQKRKSLMASTSNEKNSNIDQAIQRSDVSPTGIRAVAGQSHAEYLERELSANFDLQNFHLPSGFVTPLVSKAVVDVFKQGGKLSKNSVHKLLRLTYRQLQTLPNTSKITIAPTDRLTVVGDIHGQLADLLYILDTSGMPSPTNRYIFNGDFVDRGPCGVEVMCILMSLFLSNPGQVTLNRGNHEDFAICCAYGFQTECVGKYDEVTYGMFMEVFTRLPLFAVINSKVFVLHGGLFHSLDVTLADLDQIRRTDFTLRDMPEDFGDGMSEFIPRSKKEDFLKQLQRDALWSDPSKVAGLNPSMRGAGVMFGPDIARHFCQRNGLSLVVRSHECCRTGFDLPYLSCAKEEDRRTVCTIFSASNYGGGGNSAAYMVFTRVPLAPSEEVDGRQSKSRATASTTVVPASDLQYEIHYFHIDDEEAGIIAESDGGTGSDSEDDDRRSVSTTASAAVSFAGDLSLHQLILRKRRLLLKHFEIVDPAMTGGVPKDVWGEVMQRVLSLHISWDTLFSVLVGEECVYYPVVDRGGRLDSGNDSPKAQNSDDKVATEEANKDSISRKNQAGKTPFVLYEKFLQNFSLSAELASGAVVSGGLHSGDASGDNRSNAAPVNVPSQAPNSSLSGHLVDSLYAHHKELATIFSFFDVKKDQVISRAEFRAGMFMIHQLQMQEEARIGAGFNMPITLSNDVQPDAEFTAECDQLLDIMNLNGSGFIDLNEFFEMFRMSEAMMRRKQELGGSETVVGTASSSGKASSSLPPVVSRSRSASKGAGPQGPIAVGGLRISAD